MQKLFESDEKMNSDFLVLYKINKEKFKCTVRCSFASLTEDTCVGIFSHEAIEFILAREQSAQSELIDIHLLIGGAEGLYPKALQLADWKKNRDGLPNLFSR